MKNVKHPAQGKSAAQRPGNVAVTKTVKFVFTRATKGAVVYGEVNDKGEVIDTKAQGLDAANIGTLYLRKAHLGCKAEDGADAPKEVTVTIATA